MFCSPLCFDKKTDKVHEEIEMDVISRQPYDKSMYKVICLKHNTDLIKECKPLLKLLPKIEGNYWKTIRITDGIHTDCMGNVLSIPFPYEKTGVEFECLMQTAQQVLDEHQFYTKEVSDIDNDVKFIMKVHMANAETESIDPGLVVHQDNDQYENADLQTLLVYIDVDCVGGELDIYDKHGIHIIKTIKPKCKTNKIKCVLLDGNCYYKPRLLLSGKRIMISFQFQSEFAEDSSEDSSEDSEYDSDESDEIC